MKMILSDPRDEEMGIDPFFSSEPLKTCGKCGEEKKKWSYAK